MAVDDGDGARMRARALADLALREIGEDPEALAVIVRVVRAMRAETRNKRNVN